MLMKNKIKLAALIDLACYVGLGFLLNYFFGVVGRIVVHYDDLILLGRQCLLDETI